MPDDCTIPMDKGITIGGIVTDDMGNRLSGIPKSTSAATSRKPRRSDMWLDEDLLTDNRANGTTTTPPQNSTKPASG